MSRCRPCEAHCEAFRPTAEEQRVCQLQWWTLCYQPWHL